MSTNQARLMSLMGGPSTPGLGPAATVNLAGHSPASVPGPHKRGGPGRAHSAPTPPPSSPVQPSSRPCSSRPAPRGAEDECYA